MDSSSYIYIYRTMRKANAIGGYDSDMIKKGIPVRVSFIAAHGVHGDTVILL